MSEEKSSEGPWRLGEATPEGRLRVVSATGEPVCVMSFPDDADDHANARLVISAPTLRARLASQAKLLEEAEAARGNLRRALRKIVALNADYEASARPPEDDSLSIACNEARALLDEEALEESGWRGMESAPEDEDIVLSVRTKTGKFLQYFARIDSDDGEVKDLTTDEPLPYPLSAFECWAPLNLPPPPNQEPDDA